MATEDQPRMLVKEPLEVECRSVYVMHANVEAHGHTGSCPGYALLIMHGIATKPRKDELRERIRRVTERTLAGGVKMETYQDRIAVRKRVRERRRAQVKRYREVPEEPGNKNDEQVAVRHADAIWRLRL